LCVEKGVNVYLRHMLRSIYGVGVGMGSSLLKADYCKEDYCNPSRRDIQS